MSRRPGPDAADPGGVLLHEIVAEHARRAPEAPAVTCDGRTLAYRELDARAERLAAELRTRVHGENAVVAVLMDRSAELIVSLLAVLKAGCAYLALNTADPDRRLAELVADAGARIAVADAGAAGRLPAGLPTLTPDTTAEAGNPPRTAATGARSADDLAYVCYTSGSTGAPKGVGVTHRGVHRIAVRQDWLRLTPRDVVLQVSSVSFDASTLEIFGALCAGARLVVHPGGGPVDLDALAGTVAGQHVTVVNLPTGLLHRLVESRLPFFAGLRHVVTGGDVASPALVARLLGAWPGLTFTNGYGPTENTTFTTRWTTTGTPPPGPVPIGTAVTGTGTALLDEAMNPVPDGATGELHTWGDGLARGYLGRPAATAERFVPCPFGPPGSRMYRTGDLARTAPDGVLEFAGRTDRQVKVRGYRVEPGAVEAALARQPGVDRAVVVVERDDAEHSRLIGHVVHGRADDGAGPRLRAALAAELPAYAVPDTILVHTTLPVTAHGKVDRSALATAGPKPRNIADPYVAPRTPLQRRLAEMWSALLGIAPVGIEDDFFDLGGHSLMAAELLELMHKELGVEIPATALYLRSTVAELSEAVDEAMAGRETRP